MSDRRWCDQRAKQSVPAVAASKITSPIAPIADKGEFVTAMSGGLLLRLTRAEEAIGCRVRACVFFMLA